VYVCVRAQGLQFIVDAFSTQVLRLSTHPYGCRVIQRLLEHCADKQRKPMLHEILHHVEELCRNQYGNYVVQHVLEQGTKWQRASVFKKLCGQMHTLSRHKFASNVVEKCFVHSNAADREYMITETMGEMDGDGAKMVALVKDQFGNYVAQKMLNSAAKEQQRLIILRIKKWLLQLRKIPYGKHIIARAEKIIGHSIEASE
jgi:pumilio RNA-binding family